MNQDHYGSGKPDSRRYPYRDDIEGLQGLWGAKSGSAGSGLTATDADGPWTVDINAAPSSAAAFFPMAASSEVASSATQIAVASTTSSQIVTASRRTGNGSWITSFFGFDPDDVTYSRPAAAFGNGKYIYLWVEETDKEWVDTNFAVPAGKGMHIRKAIFDGSSFTTGLVLRSGVPLVITSPVILLGFDPASGRFLLSTMTQGSVNGAFKDRLRITTIDDAGNDVDRQVVSGLDDIAYVGKMVCDGSDCAFPYVRTIDRTTPVLFFAHGDIVNDKFAVNGTTAGGWVAYGWTDHARIPGGYAVSWQSLSGKTLIHERDCTTTCTVDSAEFNTQNTLPVALGSNFISPSHRYGALQVSSW
jgi:hypothetical protein